MLDGEWCSNNLSLMTKRHVVVRMGCQALGRCTFTTMDSTPTGMAGPTGMTATARAGTEVTVVADMEATVHPTDMLASRDSDTEAMVAMVATMACTTRSWYDFTLFCDLHFLLRVSAKFFAFGADNFPYPSLQVDTVPLFLDEV